MEHNMVFATITADDIETFWRDGYVVKRKFFDSEEVGYLQAAIETDPAIAANIVALADSEGGATELALWNHPGNDVFGMVARGDRIAGGAAALLGKEVYHYHTKLTLKRPGGGGAWDWHQDYGYWYNNGCLYPDMLSVGIAVDAATRENGCLQMIRGSHKLGRIEHGRVGGQTGADIERVEEILKHLPHDYLEMGPGDTIFFHGNTLHASDPNRSSRSRNVMLCAYNAASNDPVKEHHHPRYTPLVRVPDNAVKEAGQRGGTDITFFDHNSDATGALSAITQN
jgi:ectoine hydroxylase